jgi:hypothetical protein
MLLFTPSKLAAVFALRAAADVQAGHRERDEEEEQAHHPEGECLLRHATDAGSAALAGDPPSLRHPLQRHKGVAAPNDSLAALRTSRTDRRFPTFCNRRDTSPRPTRLGHATATLIGSPHRRRRLGKRPGGRIGKGSGTSHASPKQHPRRPPSGTAVRSLDGLSRVGRQRGRPVRSRRPLPRPLTEATA